MAYAGRDEQHAEVWLMPAAGGPAIYIAKTNLIDLAAFHEQ